jgi:hypothetical protein
MTHTLAADPDSPRQQARYQAAVSRMVARSQPPAAQPRPQSAMPAMQRPIRQPQPRAIQPQGMRQSGRMANPDMGRQLRARDFDGVRFDRGAVRTPRTLNTAAVEQPVQAPAVAAPQLSQRDANRAERLRAWVERNQPNRNRGGNVVAAPGANLENQSGAVTAPPTDQQQGGRNWGNGDHDGHRHGNRGGWRERHRDWHERHEGDPDFDRKHRRWHNRDWYRRNYNRFVLFGGGYYYWNRGYWYPAYGYHPTYSTYVYDSPIYSYNGLPPGQVLAMVQTQLQRRGYYRAAVDGTYGPVTRQALLNYQADNGLPMTGEIDQETLLSLGFE